MGDGAKSHLCRLAQHRTADIAAGSHHHIGLELLKDVRILPQQVQSSSIEERL